MKRNSVLGFILLVSFIVNLLLMYILVRNPFNYYFNQPEFSGTNYSIRNTWAQVATIGLLVFIWGSFIYSLLKSIKTKRKSFLSLAISLAFFVGLLILDDSEDYYSYSSEGDGYQYIEKYWFIKGDTLFEKWKSVKPYNSKVPSEQVEWKLIETNKK